MRLTQSFTTTVLLLLTTSLFSCGHVSVFDKEGCADEGSLGAHCAHVFTSGTRNLDKDTWDNLRFGWICYDPGDDIQMKKEEEELCSIKGVTCDYQMKQQIHSFFKKLKALKKHALAVSTQTH